LAFWILKLLWPFGENPGAVERRQNMRIIHRGIILLVACAVAVLGLSGPVAYAQPPQLPDHHKVYSVDPLMQPTLPMPVTLEDQFGVAEGMAEFLRMFSPPVAKSVPGGDNTFIMNPEDHLTWYTFTTEPQEPRTVLIKNQFDTFLEDQIWLIGNPVYLALPAWKLEVNGMPTGLNHPSELDHYLCYEVLEGDPVGLQGVTLSDQFDPFHVPPGPEVVDVVNPLFLCNPVDKILVHGIPEEPPWPIFLPENHLACYDIVPHEPLGPLQVLANDQFGDSLFQVIQNELLCVPSEKCPDMDGDGYVDENCGGDDCDDTDASINPAAEESSDAGNCSDGKDNDCDGLTDTDPECGGGCTASVVGSTYETSPVRGSSELAKHLAYFLLPVGAGIGLILLRRKRQ
jgi:hypothetical protein